MDLFKKHVDTVIILSAFGASVLWMSARFNDVNDRFNNVEKEMAVLKTVLIMQNIMPKELAANTKIQGE